MTVSIWAVYLLPAGASARYAAVEWLCAEGERERRGEIAFADELAGVRQVIPNTFVHHEPEDGDGRAILETWQPPEEEEPMSVALVLDVMPPPAEQLLLRPVPSFIEAVLVAPAAARRRCAARRPPRRTPIAALWLKPKPGPPIRPRKLRVVPERRQRAGQKPVQINVGAMNRAEKREHGRVLWDLVELGINPRHRPKTFGECRPGPCPWVGCRLHLYLDVIESPNPGEAPFIKLNFPHLEPDQLVETCALRIANLAEAANEETPTEEVAKLVNLTAERLRQIEARAKEKMGPGMEAERRQTGIG